MVNWWIFMFCNIRDHDSQWPVHSVNIYIYTLYLYMYIYIFTLYTFIYIYTVYIYIHTQYIYIYTLYIYIYLWYWHVFFSPPISQTNLLNLGKDAWPSDNGCQKPGWAVPKTTYMRVLTHCFSCSVASPEQVEYYGVFPVQTAWRINRRCWASW